MAGGNPLEIIYHLLETVDALLLGLQFEGLRF